MSAIVCLTLLDILKRRMVSAASASLREIMRKCGVYKIIVITNVNEIDNWKTLPSIYKDFATLMNNYIPVVRTSLQMLVQLLPLH